MKAIYRGRRLRKTDQMRSMVAETKVQSSDLIQPYFVIEGKNKKEPIESMPGVERMSQDLLLPEIESLQERGIDKILLFGVPSHKDRKATSAWQKDNIVESAIVKIKETFPSTLLIADVCLCAYTDHGHCGHLLENGSVDNDATLEILSKVALSYARAGADVIAPSDMMDGRISAIRQTLDANGFQETPILSYAAKYASAFYGPFRDAAKSTPKQGNRKTYQMDPANAKEAYREISADLKEGADMVMVKPAMPYLDIIKMAKDRFAVPVFAYNVSGEYSMVKAMGKLGWGDEKALAMEMLTAIKRAGADRIITYFAKYFHDLIK